MNTTTRTLPMGVTAANLAPREWQGVKRFKTVRSDNPQNRRAELVRLSG